MAIKTHFSKLLGERRLRAAHVARKTGITPHTLSQLYNERLEGIRFETLDKLCKCLKCSVSDLIEYIPDKERKK